MAIDKPLGEHPPAAVLDAYELAGARLRRVESGHINRTWLVDKPGGPTFVLQWVNPVFGVESQRDIDAVTRHLERRGNPTPRLVPTREGELFVRQDDAIWRELTYIEGRSYERIEGPKQAREAGRVLAEFHVGVSDFRGTLESKRGNVHDIGKHLAALAAALDRHADHRELARVRGLAERVFESSALLPSLGTHRERIVHGDPKISNILFGNGGRIGICLIDLDTITRMPVVLELGDAFRSWCNPAAEDAAEAGFALNLYRAAIEGYAGAAPGFLTRTECRDIPAAIATIAVELAARFCLDALNETYFRWDRVRYASASRHHQARTLAQLNVASAALAQHGPIAAVTKRALGSAADSV